MDDVSENDQCLYYVSVTVLIVAESKEELESITETVETIGKRNSVTIDTHYLKQREALNTALPIGVRQVETMRTMLTQSLAVLMPFNVQVAGIDVMLDKKTGKPRIIEINGQGDLLYQDIYGENIIYRNQILNMVGGSMV